MLMDKIQWKNKIAIKYREWSMSTLGQTVWKLSMPMVLIVTI